MHTDVLCVTFSHTLLYVDLSHVFAITTGSSQGVLYAATASASLGRDPKARRYSCQSPSYLVEVKIMKEG